MQAMHTSYMNTQVVKIICSPHWFTAMGVVSTLNVSCIYTGATKD